MRGYLYEEERYEDGMPIDNTQTRARTLQGEFSFPYSVCATEHEIFVADVANHRIQVRWSPGMPVMNSLCGMPVWAAMSVCGSPCE